MKAIPTERVATWLLAAIALLLTAPAFAQHAGKRNKADHTDSPAAAGSTAATDGAQLRALTPEESRALLDGISRYVDQSSEGLTQRNRPDGSVSIDLDERFQSVTMARVGADGKATTRCVTNAAEARSFLGPDARPAKKLAKKSKVKAAKQLTKPEKLTVAGRPALEER